MKTKTLLICLLLVLALAAWLPAADYYAAPMGTASPTCSGTLGCPWDLQTALNKPLAGGDRLFLLGGVNQGNFTSTLNGNGTQITLLPYTDFQVRINGSIGFFSGGYVTVEGFEFYNSNTNRTLSTGPDCITTEAPSIILLHNIIHDCSTDGIGFWSSNPNGVAYGNIIYYNGYNAADRGHGHGIYVQNEAPATKLIEDNIILNQFGWGIQAYTEGGNIDNITLRGNFLSMNGSLSTVGLNENIIVNGYVVAKNDVLDSNVAYYPSGGRPTNVDLGFYAGVANATVVNNYIIGGDYSLDFYGSSTITGNYIAGPVLDFNTKSYPNNTYGNPADPTVILRPDLYEPGRANVAVFNVSGASPAPAHASPPPPPGPGNKPAPPLPAPPTKAVTSVTVPVASLGYNNGDSVVVATAEDYFGPHRSFTVSGGAITLPLTGWTVAKPIGWKAPATTLQAFGIFILRRSF